MGEVAFGSAGSPPQPPHCATHEPPRPHFQGQNRLQTPPSKPGCVVYKGRGVGTGVRKRRPESWEDIQQQTAARGSSQGQCTLGASGNKARCKALSALIEGDAAHHHHEDHHHARHAPGHH